MFHPFRFFQKAFAAEEAPTQTSKEGGGAAPGVELPQFEAGKAQSTEGQSAAVAGTTTAAIEEEEVGSCSISNIFWD